MAEETKAPSKAETVACPRCGVGKFLLVAELEDGIARRCGYCGHFETIGAGKAPAKAE